MNDIKNYIYEAFKIRKGIELNLTGNVDRLPPKSTERANCAYDIVSERYKKVFNKIEILRTNNIKFSEIEQKGTIYDTSTFTLYLNQDDIYILRRTDGRGQTAKLLDNISSFDELLTRFDKLLIKKGYTL